MIKKIILGTIVIITIFALIACSTTQERKWPIKKGPIELANEQGASLLRDEKYTKEYYKKNKKKIKAQQKEYYQKNKEKIREAARKKRSERLNVKTRQKEEWKLEVLGFKATVKCPRCDKIFKVKGLEFTGNGMLRKYCSKCSLSLKNHTNSTTTSTYRL